MLCCEVRDCGMWVWALCVVVIVYLGEFVQCGQSVGREEASCIIVDVLGMCI